MPTGTQYLAIGVGVGAVYYGLRTIWRPNLLTVMDDDDSSSDESGKNKDKVRNDGVQRWGGAFPRHAGQTLPHSPTSRGKTIRDCWYRTCVQTVAQSLAINFIFLPGGEM